MTGRLVGEDFVRLFRTFASTAFRLETRDHYAVSDEAEAYEQFLADEPFGLDWLHSWLRGIREMTAAGRRVSRVRLMSEPPADYQRFELAVTPANLEAGEDIRFLPRSLAADLRLPDHDFWIFDDTRVYLMHFDDAGAFRGAEQRGDDALDSYRAARPGTAPAAVPWR